MSDIFVWHSIHLFDTQLFVCYVRHSTFLIRHSNHYFWPFVFRIRHWVLFFWHKIFHFWLGILASILRFIFSTLSFSCSKLDLFVRHSILRFRYSIFVVWHLVVTCLAFGFFIWHSVLVCQICSNISFLTLNFNVQPFAFRIWHSLLFVWTQFFMFDTQIYLFNAEIYLHDICLIFNSSCSTLRLIFRH